MNSTKIFKRICVGALAAGMAFTVVTAAGCSNKNNPDGPDNQGDVKYYNNDTDPVSFSTQPLDGMFSPYYSTTAPDSSVVSMTQIGLLGNDEKGEVTYGADEAVLALDYEERINKEDWTDADWNNGLSTTYFFVLKNNVYFSDGTPVTMKDVLFNLYEYLDPSYYGSATLYSTDIVGLQAYRTQQVNENDQDNANIRFETAATTRINNLKKALNNIEKKKDQITGGHGNLTEELVRNALSDENITDVDAADEAKLIADFDKALEFFKQELKNDYSSARDTYNDHSETDSSGKTVKGFFTTDMEMFLYNEGEITWNKKDGQMECTFASGAEGYQEARSWTEQQAIDYVYNNYVPDDIISVVSYWGTANDLYEYLVATERSESHSAELDIPNIEGIKFANREESVTVNGTTYRAIGKGTTNYNSDGSPKEGYNEVLSITINNIDPKAKWNFGIGVAPMSYYSNEEEIAKFDYEKHFGVSYDNRDFQDKVIKDQAKIGVPMGAGPYAASCESGGVTGITGAKFYSNKMVYFERNPYYNMGAGENGVARIKSVRYVETPTAGLTQALYTHGIDYATPNAKNEVITELEGKKDDGIAYKTITTMGYGYIGVNAGKVPSIFVRRAIMHAINTQSCVDYYGSRAKLIHRSMSTENFAYPQGATAYYPYIGGPIPENLNVVYPDYADFVEAKGKKAGDTFTEAEQIEYIQMLLKKGGYSGAAGTTWSNGTDSLKYDFTIVGSETDHPAWNAMLQAGQFLEKCGFTINTKTDAQGLKKLNDGDLAVWAAAWGSTIDPDMYQVYHIESKATSVYSWGYREIKLNRDKYSTEYSLLLELSDLIDEGRESLDNKPNGRRAQVYSDALDVLMELAVELPTYQRDDLFAWDDNKIDSSTFNQTPTSFLGLTADLQNVSLRVAQ